MIEQDRIVDFGRGPRAEIGWLLALLLATACAATPFPRASQSEHSRQGLVIPEERLLVLPFREGSPLPAYGNHVMCHLTGEHLEAGDVPKGAGEELGEILARQLAAAGADVVPYGESVRLLAGADRDAASRYEPSLGVSLARQAGAAKAILGVVTRYEDRSGYAYASGTPARISFSLALVDARTETVTHKLSVNREQAPLTSNLFSFRTWWRRGFRWWSREEVAEEALATSARAMMGAAVPEDAWASMPSSLSPRHSPSRQSIPQPAY